jgi:hypothetical protein
MKRHTVEITFEVEELSTIISEHDTTALYRTEDDTYFVYIDGRKSGGGAVLEVGHYPRGLSELSARQMFPDLFVE